MDFTNNRQLSQSRPEAGKYPSMAGSKRQANWLLRGAIILIIFVAVIFCLAVYSEISSRSAELNSFLSDAKKQTAGPIAGNDLLSGLTADLNSAGSSSTVATSSPDTNIVSVSNANRQLIEKRANRPMFGNASSSLVIVEFGDFDCPNCLAEYPIIQSVINRHAKDVLFIFRNYPIEDDNSSMLAQASLCALDQGKFWQLHNRLFDNQGQITGLDDFKLIVIKSGLNWDKLEKCVNDGKYQKQVTEDTQDAVDLGVQGTPTFFVNGHILPGVVTEDAWEQVISKAEETKN